MTDGGDGPRNLATVKFNFIAWAFRNSKKYRLGATDLMVLAQLLVRFDPERGAFAMSAETLAHRTGTSVSSVRRSLLNLEDIGDIVVIARPGQSSEYMVRFERAPQNWIASEREHYEAVLAKRDGITPPGRSLAKSDKGSAKILQGGAPKSDKSPYQDLSAVSIHSNHPDISSSMRPDGREAVVRHVGRTSEEEAETREDESASRRMDNDPPFGGEDVFQDFVSIWPKTDLDLGKLRAAWYKRVVKPGFDPKDVIGAALEWRRYFRADPERNKVPYAGKWLAENGWLKQTPDTIWPDDAED